MGKLAMRRRTLVSVSTFFLSIGSLAQAEISPDQPSNTQPSGPAASPPEPKGTPQPTSSRAIRKPVALSTPVPPLQGKWDPAEVVLLLVITSEGTVSQAEIVSGSEPFTTAALAASASWTFEPAYRENQAVASKIHFLLTFKPRPAPSTTKSSPTQSGSKKTEQESTPAPVSEAQGQALQEVTVFGKLPDPSSTSLTRGEVRNLAGAFDDPLRAIEVMPGVTPIASGLPLFFIRGAPPGNVGYFIDGIRIPLLYHAFLGPSVIHPAFIDAVTLNPGPIPTRYGRFAGATVEAEMASPSGAARAEASIRLLDAGAFVETPFAQGRGYAMLGGRYSYTGLLVSAFSPGQRVEYWDYQGLFGYALTKKDEVSVLSLGAYDYIGSDGEVLGGTEFHRIDLRWNHKFSQSSEARWAATWGRDRTRSDSGYISDNLLGTRVTFEHRRADFILRTGADFNVDKYDMEIDAAISEPEIYEELFPPRTDMSGGAYADIVIFPGKRIQLTPGVRTDVFSSLGQTRISFDPRIFAEFQLTPSLKAIHALGVAHQTPNFVPSIPGAQVAGLEGGLQQSLHASTKYEALLPLKLTGSIAFFINGTKNMTDPIGLGQSLSIDENSAEQRSLGRAAGMEIYIKRPLTRNLGGLLSYTLSKTLRSLNQITTAPGYDRPHVLNGALTYDFGFHIRASAKGSIASGIPGRETTEHGFIYNQSRSFPYMRLDLKLAKRWYVSENFFWGAHVEVLNATHTPSVARRTCKTDGCTNEGTAPITFPSLGIEANWR